MIEGVVAVVVTYHPKLEHLGVLLDELGAQVSKTIVVDNGSNEEVLAWLSGCEQSGRIKLFDLGSNFGLGYAQNRGIEFALSAGAGFVLLMDQDSLPLPTMVAKLRQATISLFKSGRRVAAVGPRCVAAPDAADTMVFPMFDRFPPTKGRCNTEFENIRTDQLIASGMLIPAKVFETVGLMDETLFIDQIDIDWCFRARMHGMSLFGVCGAKLIHGIGLGNARIWFGRWRIVFTHSPMRNYFFCRNSLVLIKRRYSPPLWRLYIACFLVLWALRTVFLPPKSLRARLVLKGIYHGCINRLGPL